ncbi:MAG: 3-phosphoshikimate 1-carboxyvinyltransferase [Actinomycetota bacterium]|nr:3-phosphoshikimate 1-carboxyvinyltransferase [Actinomycetota bacterium]
MKRLRVPGDKSISHRALLLAARAEGVSRVSGLSDGEDVRHTAAAVAAMGARIDGDRIHGGELHGVDGVIDVGNSGTGMRLLAGYCAALPWRTVLRGDESVDRRPMDRVAEPLRLMGARIDEAYPPLAVDGGGLHGIDYALPVPSAQVKGAVLLAGLGAEGDTVVRESVPTRMHTEELLQLAGADVEVGDGVVRVRASALHPFELDVPGDPSQAAFWVVAGAIVPGMELVVENVYVGPGRGGFLDVLRRMGADIEVDGGDIHVRSSPLHATEVAGVEVPGLIDEIPVLAVAAACAEGTTVFRDAAELRVKESDRVATVVEMLRTLGATAEEAEDGLSVTGPARLHGGHVDSQGDHRIAMSAAIAGLVADGPVTVERRESVATSYPGFEEDLRRCVS